MMIKTFTMKVLPECHNEYKKRHNPIWKELTETLKSHGVLKYSIFLDPDTDTLFAYAEIESEERWLQIAQTDVCQKWWENMKDIMPTQPDNSPTSRDLHCVFNMS